MITPIVAQSSVPMAAIQQNTDAQSTINTSIAVQKVQEKEREQKETVIKKDEAVFYEQHHDAKEEGRNKYQNLYNNKKKKTKTENQNTLEVNRVNFDIKL